MSPYYHSFGNFLKNETSRLIGDAMPKDHPMDMNHLDSSKSAIPSVAMIEKLAH